MANLVGYSFKPNLESLVLLNGDLSKLPGKTRKDLFHYITDAILKRSTLSHVFVLSGIIVLSFFVSYLDTNWFSASGHEAFTLGIGTFIGLVAIYVAYLGLTGRK
jgi:hypothetical protein